MIESRWMVALSALAVATAACGGRVVVDDLGAGGAGGAGAGSNPLVGVWNGGGGAPTVLGQTLTIGADGTATAVDTFGLLGVGAVSCSGALHIQDAWTSTASTISFSGGTCTGLVTCPVNTIPCGASETASQTCTYTLGAGDTTLVLDCPLAQGPLSYTRQN